MRDSERVITSVVNNILTMEETIRVYDDVDIDSMHATMCQLYEPMIEENFKGRYEYLILSYKNSGIQEYLKIKEKYKKYQEDRCNHIIWSIINFLVPMRGWKVEKELQEASIRKLIVKAKLTERFEGTEEDIYNMIQEYIYPLISAILVIYQKHSKKLNKEIIPIGIREGKDGIEIYYTYKKHLEEDLKRWRKGYPGKRTNLDKFKPMILK